MLTYTEITAKCSAEMLANRDDAAIAAAVSAGRTAIKPAWLTDRGLVSALLNATGSMAMSDSILNKLAAVAASSPSVSAIQRRLQNDPTGIDFGDTGFRANVQAMTPGVFSAAECDALLALSVQPDPVTVYDVARAMEGH
jgi:hypothetical protein